MRTVVERPIYESERDGFGKFKRILDIEEKYENKNEDIKELCDMIHSLRKEISARREDLKKITEFGVTLKNSYLEALDRIHELEEENKKLKEDNEKKLSKTKINLFRKN